MSNRPVKYDNKRAAVIHAAGQAFRVSGYHNTSMADIAQQLGLTKPALYYYVKNKEEVLFECHIMAYQAMTEILSRPVAGETALDGLASYFHDFVMMLTDKGVSLLTDVNSLRGENRARVLSERKNIERSITQLVEAGQKDGSVRDGDTSLLTFYFMGALNWLNAWYRTDGRIEGQDIAAAFTEQLRAGLSAKQ